MPVALTFILTLTVVTAANAQLLGWRPTYDSDDPYQLPDAPLPATLPDLTHRGVAALAAFTFASVKLPLQLNGKAYERVGLTTEQIEVETALANRRWYAGISQAFAQGGTLSGDEGAALVSNPEIWGRALWASRAGLAYGGGFGLVLPIIDHEQQRGPSVKGTMRVVHPWDFPLFSGRALAFRPYIDVRVIDGPILLQLRQGMDVLRSFSDEEKISETTLTSRTTLYLGYRPFDSFGGGLELWEVYFVRAPGVADNQRAVFSVSPCLRWMTPVVQPAISGLFPIGTPLFNQAESYWALRLSLGLVLGF
ncbi:MAG: hypothetical protein CSA75_01465 [Sorangium cellulosum]|nr:MAG: hypothetical protein CSA75_01465 [Sorangium cellulosum]